MLLKKVEYYGAEYINILLTRGPQNRSNILHKSRVICCSIKKSYMLLKKVEYYGAQEYIHILLTRGPQNRRVIYCTRVE